MKYQTAVRILVSSSNPNFSFKAADIEYYVINIIDIVELQEKRLGTWSPNKECPANLVYVLW